MWAAYYCSENYNYNSKEHELESYVSGQAAFRTRTVSRRLQNMERKFQSTIPQYSLRELKESLHITSHVRNIILLESLCHKMECFGFDFQYGLCKFSSTLSFCLHSVTLASIQPLKERNTKEFPWG
jgi:hypothetical protein